MRKELIIVLLGILLLPLVIAVPPQATSTLIERGIDIVYPGTPYIKVNTDLEIDFWTYNSTSGQTFTNSTINCTFYIMNNKGNNSLKLSSQVGSSGRILYGKGLPLCTNCWTSTIKAGNFTTPGLWTYQAKCQGNGIGGYHIGQFEVTQDGTYDENNRKIYIVIAILILSAFFFGMTFIFDTRGYLIKTGLIVISMLFVIIASNIMLESAITLKEMSMTYYSFVIAIVAAIAVIAFMFIYYFINIVKALRDAKLNSETEVL